MLNKVTSWLFFLWFLLLVSGTLNNCKTSKSVKKKSNPLTYSLAENKSQINIKTENISERLKSAEDVKTKSKESEVQLSQIKEINDKDADDLSEFLGELEDDKKKKSNESLKVAFKKDNSQKKKTQISKTVKKSNAKVAISEVLKKDKIKTQPVALDTKKNKIKLSNTNANKATVVVKPKKLSKKKTKVTAKVENGKKTFYYRGLIFFQYNSTFIAKKYRNQLAHIKIKNNQQVTIYGYSDSLGYEKYNYKLSRLRAKKVYRFLKRKYPGAKYVIKAFGEKHPRFSNTLYWGRQLNRRVFVFVTSD